VFHDIGELWLSLLSTLGDRGKTGEIGECSSSKTTLFRFYSSQVETFEIYEMSPKRLHAKRPRKQTFRL